MKRFFVVGLLLLATTASLTGSDFNKAGRTVMQFVKIGIGGHQTALGENGVVAVRDVNAMFWNPAAISGIQSVEASFSYNRWFADMNYMAGAAGVRIPDIGIVSIGMSSLDYGQIDEALVHGKGTSSNTRTGSTFGGGDLMAGLSVAREITEQLSLGVSVKYLREKLFTYSSDAFAFDVGTYYDTGFKGFKFGMSFQNFGGTVKFMEQGAQEAGYDLPLLFRLGMCVNVLSATNGLLSAGEGHTFLLAFEALNSNDYGDRYHLGGEYLFMDLLALRAGYRFNYAEGQLSLGLGVKATLGGLGVRVDYSYVKYEFLDSPHRVTLSVTF
jgi:hypothetical protein